MTITEAEGQALVTVCKNALQYGTPTATVISVLFAWCRMRAELEVEEDQK